MDAKYNLRYIATETRPQVDVVLQEEEHDDKVADKDDADVEIDEIPAKVYASQAAIRQPLRECDLESDLPCSCPMRNFADPPEHIPLPATRSNIPTLESWIRGYFNDSAFNQCKRQQWRTTTDKPMKIHNKPETIPYCCKKTTIVPLNFRAQVKADIEADVKKGILERVPAGEHNTWCSRMVIQSKKNGKARRTVDLSYLSKHGLDESHPGPRSSPSTSQATSTSPPWTALTGTTASHWQRRIDTRQPSPQNGASSATGARREVEFAGFLITEDRIKPAAKYTAAIRHFPTPSNISEVRSWYGLVNPVTYCFCKTEIMSPFRHLLSPNTPFQWTDELEEAFAASKEKNIELIQKGVYSFDPTLETCLSTDYSKEGMGWILQPKTCECQKISLTCCLSGVPLIP